MLCCLSVGAEGEFNVSLLLCDTFWKKISGRMPLGQGPGRIFSALEFLRGLEHLLLLHRTQVQFPTTQTPRPISVTPLAGDMKPSSDLYRYQSHTCMYIHMHSEKTFILIKIYMFKKVFEASMCLIYLKENLWLEYWCDDLYIYVQCLSIEDMSNVNTDFHSFLTA